MKLYKMSLEERWKALEKVINKEALEILKKDNQLSFEIANRMIENVIGRIQLPLGLLTNFKMNGKSYLVPMVMEEPSVIAGANKASKLTLPEGFSAKADDSIMIGQIQLKIENEEKAITKLNSLKEEIEKMGKDLTSNLEKYGGGWKGWRYMILKTFRGPFLLIEFLVNVADAMGANTINTVAETLASLLHENNIGTPKLRILSNLAIYRKVYAKAVWKRDIIGDEGVEGVLDAYAFALYDYYRLATNNKGIMNGIDAVALATGQDWRAIEAGCHTYSAISGFKPLAYYYKNKYGDLVGEIEIPLVVATVGGATKTLPHAKASLDILGVKNAKELAMIMASVGLANNFAALYALSTEGIQKGHMKLHAKNIAIMAGANSPYEIDAVAKKLSELKNYSLDKAKEILNELKEKE